MVYSTHHHMYSTYVRTCRHTVQVIQQSGRTKGKVFSQCECQLFQIQQPLVAESINRSRTQAISGRHANISVQLGVHLLCQIAQCSQIPFSVVSYWSPRKIPYPVPTAHSQGHKFTTGNCIWAATESTGHAKKQQSQRNDCSQQFEGVHVQ